MSRNKKRRATIPPLAECSHKPCPWRVRSHVGPRLLAHHLEQAHPSAQIGMASSYLPLPPTLAELPFPAALPDRLLLAGITAEAPGQGARA